MYLFLAKKTYIAKNMLQLILINIKIGVKMEFKPKNPQSNQSILEQFGRNLNDEAAMGKIDPVIGREEEIRRITEIISRKKKNNPILIGEPGVGKTAIVEGLAQRIVSGDVPDNLKNKEIYELSISSLISGASFQGQFEQRLNDVIKHVKKSNGNIILFIDEFHQLIGAGKTGANSGMDAANILKPMMARGEVKIIGATTLSEYRQYVEKDAALERRMSKIIVSEPTKQEALTIMRGLKEKWEVYHGVKIHDNALVAAVDLSDRYITDRYLPDKAIDLVDEAAAKVQTEMHSIPHELDNVRRQIIHLETEKAALEQEKNDSKSKNQLEKVIKKLDQFKIKDSELTKVWEAEKVEHEKLMLIKEKIETTRFNVEKSQLSGNFTQASKLLYIEIPKLEKELLEAEKTLKSKGLIRDSVTNIEIGEVISKSTGIPLNKIVEDEKEKLLKLTDEMQVHVKGQEQTLKLISNAVLRNRAGINDPNRPIGSFLFLGPTGVGKTEVARSLAYCLFDNYKSMVRLDMSEYMEKHSISKLIGAPPGYVGYEQAGALTESVRRKPYSVVLFDEIEKAHPDVLNLLLQILDDGSIKDSQGRMINFKNTIIIMTSNIGATAVLENKPEEALEELKGYLKPEFINRIDEISIFNSLSDEVIIKIISKMLNELSNRLKENQYNVEFDETIKKQIQSAGFDPLYGARPLKRYIQSNVENKLAEKIIDSEIKKETNYLVSYDDKNKNIEIKEK